MGMFLFQYSMLKALVYEGEPQIKEETEKILAPYKLFTLVLHDPEKHSSFHHKFSQLFERLDYLTGSNLLFMGIARPSYDWFQRNESRDYFGIWEKDQLMKSFHEIKGAEASITCYSIANALNIDYDDLPCLIISPDFQSKHFVVLKTGEVHIENQLMELGYFSGSVADKRAFMYSESFKLLLRSINFYNQSEFVTSQEALGTSLADIFSFSVMENTHFGRDAKKHSSLVLNKLANKISKAKGVEEIENAKMSVLTNLANKFNDTTHPLTGISNNSIRQSRKPRNDELFSVYSLNEPDVSSYSRKRNLVEDSLSFLKNNDSLLEAETSIIVATTNAVYKMFKEISNNDNVDYSLLVLGFSKVFEIEINLSVVHWVRKYLKIEMPHYYKKFKPDCINAIITPDEGVVASPRAIDFNMHKGAKWIAPGIGQSEVVVRSLFRNNLFIESFSNREEAGLLDAWSPLRESRNRAAHTEIMKSEDLQNVALNLNALIESNNLSKILRLKQQYNGTMPVAKIT